MGLLRSLASLLSLVDCWKSTNSVGTLASFPYFSNTITISIISPICRLVGLACDLDFLLLFSTPGKVLPLILPPNFALCLDLYPL
jgi:hypothetical protein